MKRSEFVKFCQTKNTNHIRDKVLVSHIMVDPSFARTGRQMIFDPLPIDYRMQYNAGVPLNKDNPFAFKEFDKLYPDNFAAMQEARTQIDDTKQNLDKIQRESQQQQSQQQQ